MISVLTPSIRPQFLNITQETLEKQTFKDFEWLVEIGLRHTFTLSRDNNKMLRRAKGERVVFLQDCISLEPDALQRISELPNQFYTFPVGKVRETFGETPVWDWREHKSWEIDPGHWESDFACAPTKAFYDIGGYDEEFDRGWAWDNVEVAHRAKAAGYFMYCDNSIRGIAWDHDAHIAHPWRTTRETNMERARITREKAERGDYRLDNL